MIAQDDASLDQRDLIPDQRHNAEILQQVRERRDADLATAAAFNPVMARGEEPAEYITRLWNALSCLRRKIVMTPVHWNAKAIARQCGPWSTGEWHAAQFVLSVWCPGEFKKFNLADAASTLGTAERRVIATWTTAPHWP